MKKCILLDMYGVIIKESKGYFIPFVLERIPKISKQVIIDNFDQAGIGRISSKEFLRNLGFTENFDSLIKTYITQYLTIDDQFANFINCVKDKYEIDLLSNDVSEWNKLIMEINNISQYFKKTIISGNVGYKKPDKKIYEIALNEIGKNPDEIIFIDNSVKNLRTAEELGIKTILFNRDNEEYDGKIVNNFKELFRKLEDF